MATEIERLVARIEGDMSGLRAEVGKARALMDRHAKQMNSTLAGMDRRFAALGAAARQALGVVSVAAFTQLVRSAMNYADTLADVSAQTGLHVEALQELRFAAAQVGLEQASVDKALTKFTINLGQAVTLGGEYSRTFQQMGVATHDSSGKLRSSEAVMQDVFEALSKIEDVALRNALAYKVFGKEAGPAFAQFAAQGTEAINAQRKAAQELGAVMSKDMIDRADKAADEMTALAQAIKTQAMVAVADLSPLLVELARGFSTVVRVVGELGRGLQYTFGLIEAAPLEKEIERIEQDVANLQALIAQANSTGVAVDTQGSQTTVEALNQKLRGTLDLLEQTKQKQFDLLTGGPPAAKPPGTAGLDVEGEEARKAREAAEKAREADLDRQAEVLLAIEDYTREHGERQQAQRERALGERLDLLRAEDDAIARSNEIRLEDARRAAEEHLAIIGASAESFDRLNEFERMSAAEKYQGLSELAAGFAASMSRTSRKAFEVSKALAIAQAVVSTYNAASGAFASAMQSGAPYYVAVLKAAAALAYGFAQVRAIKSTQFGGAGPGAVSAGSPAAGADDVGGGGFRSQPRQVVYIQGLNPNDLYSGRQLIDLLNQAQGDGAVLRVVS